MHVFHTHRCRNVTASQVGLGRRRIRQRTKPEQWPTDESLREPFRKIPCGHSPLKVNSPTRNGALRKLVITLQRCFPEI